MSASLAEEVAALPDDLRDEAMADLFPDARQLEALEFAWEFWGRPEQIWRPSEYAYDLWLAGRGWGKTAGGANATHYVAQHPELCGGRVAEGPDDKRAGRGAVIAIAGRTAKDVNRTMVDGDSGIMASCDPALRPRWNKTDCELTWPNGVRARLMSADVPESLRGPNFGWFWADELAHWKRLVAAWKMLKYTHRLASPGQHPRGLITTTPLGVQTIVEIAWKLKEGQPVLAGPDTPIGRILQGFEINPRTRITAGGSYENVANLASDFLIETLGQLEGTEDAAQEIHAQIRLGVPGSPWKQDWFRRCEPDEVPSLDKVIVAVDPTVSDGERPQGMDQPCECGIVAMGREDRRRRVYLLRDRSFVATPMRWADRVVELAIEVGAQEIHAEDNQGGQMVRSEVEAALTRASRESARRGMRRPRVVLVRATRDKLQRFGATAPCWEQGKVWHVGSPRHWVSMERQMTQLDPNRPIKGQQCDRSDAASWGIFVLLGDGTDRTRPWALTDAESWRRIAQAHGG